MMPKYKKVSVYRPFCPTCNEQLRGENSQVFPYQCGCGTWRAECSYDEKGNYGCDFVIEPIKTDLQSSGDKIIT